MESDSSSPRQSVETKPSVARLRPPVEVTVEEVSRKAAGTHYQALYNAVLLSDAAASLDDQIARIEAGMATIPWKSEKSVLHREGGTLSYERAGDGWALFWSETDSAAVLVSFIALLGNASSDTKRKLPQITKKFQLRDASVEVKVKASEVLLDLVQQVKSASQGRLELIREAQSNLVEAEKALFGSSLKGGGQ